MREPDLLCLVGRQIATTQESKNEAGAKVCGEQEHGQECA